MYLIFYIVYNYDIYNYISYVNVFHFALFKKIRLQFAASKMPMRLRKNTHAVSAAARISGKCAVRPVGACTMWEGKKRSTKVQVVCVTRELLTATFTLSILHNATCISVNLR